MTLESITNKKVLGEFEKLETASKKLEEGFEKEITKDLDNLKIINDRKKDLLQSIKKNRAICKIHDKAIEKFLKWKKRWKRKK